MSELGQSLQIVAHRKSLHVRCSPKATQSQSLGICRSPGPRLRLSAAFAVVAVPAIALDVYLKDRMVH